MTFINLSVEFDRLRDVQGRFRSLESGLVRDIGAVTRTALGLAVVSLKDHAPRDESSETPGSSLADKIRLGNVTANSAGVVGFIILPHVAIYTLPPGTRPHEIKPRGRYPLRFFWDKMNMEAEFWSVHHPGYQVDESGNWAKDAINAITPAVATELRRAGLVRITEWGEGP